MTVNQGFLAELTPSLNSSLGLNITSSGFSPVAAKADRRTASQYHSAVFSTQVAVKGNRIQTGGLRTVIVTLSCNRNHGNVKPASREVLLVIQKIGNDKSNPNT